MQELGGGGSKPSPEPGALFVVLRFVGGFAALAGAAGFGLVRSEAHCFPSAVHETWWSAAAIAVSLSGVVAAVRAWSPRGLGKWIGAVLLLTLLVTSFLAPRVRYAEMMRGQVTFRALRELAELTLDRQREGGQVPQGSGPVESMPELLVPPPHYPPRRALPSRDAWGNPLHYQGDGNEFAFLATCRCGRLDAADWRQYDRGWVEDPRADLMFVHDYSCRSLQVWNAPSHIRFAQTPPPR